MESIIAWLINFIHQAGYIGIFIMTLVESTFVPIPSEVTMLPAGYLVQQGQMNFWLVVIASVTGTVAGAYVNYWLAKRYGRWLFLRYGKFFSLNDAKLAWIERYFAEHGPVSIFTGRLIPGVRHYISFPAGLANMDLRRFFLYTALGGGIWMVVLIAAGYYLGENQHLVKKYLLIIKISLLTVVALGLGWYWLKRKRLRKTLGADGQ